MFIGIHQLKWMKAHNQQRLVLDFCSDFSIDEFHFEFI